MEFIEYPDREILALSLADRIAGALAQHLRAEDRASLCVPGGTTPSPVFDMLSAADLDWDRVTVFLGDERWVPGDHPRSNTRLLHRHLLTGRAAAADYIDLYTGDATPEAGATALAPRIEAHLPVTVALLGMGNDMHTASLFPGAPQLAEALADDAQPLMAIHADGAGEPRITLTARVLRNTIETHLMITGPEKRAALEFARGLDPMHAPIRALLDHATVHWAA